MNTERFETLFKRKNQFNIPKLNQFVPHPNDTDYKRGYIVRYFVQKANDTNSPVYEVNSNTFTSYNNIAFYTTVSLDWRLTGSDEQIKESNYQSVKLASKTMKAILFYLPNYLQFKEKKDLVV